MKREKCIADGQMSYESKKKQQNRFKMLFFLAYCYFFVNKFGRKSKKL